MWQKITFILNNYTLSHSKIPFEFFKESVCTLYSSCPCGIIHARCFKVFELLYTFSFEKCEMFSFSVSLGCIKVPSWSSFEQTKSSLASSFWWVVVICGYPESFCLSHASYFTNLFISRFTDFFSAFFWVSFPYFIQCKIFFMIMLAWSASEKTMPTIVTKTLIFKLP